MSVRTKIANVIVDHVYDAHEKAHKAEEYGNDEAAEEWYAIAKFRERFLLPVARRLDPEVAREVEEYL